MNFLNDLRAGKIHFRILTRIQVLILINPRLILFCFYVNSFIIISKLKMMIDFRIFDSHFIRLDLFYVVIPSTLKVIKIN